MVERTCVTGRPLRHLRALRSGFFLGLALIVTGCAPVGSGSGGLSVEEAREIATKFAGAEFEPPARSVVDILESFGPEQEIPNNCDEVRARREPELADWGKIGWGGTSRTVNIIKHSLSRRYIRAAGSEFFAGNYRNTLKYAKEATLNTPLDWKDGASEMFYMLARYHAFSGNLKKARSNYRRGNALHYASKHSDEFFEERAEAHALVAKGSIAHMEGQHRNAELIYRLILREYGHALRSYIPRLLIQSDLAETLGHQGRLAEAEAEARDAIGGYYVYSPQIAYYLLRLSRIVYAQGRYRDAEDLSRRVINIHEASCARAGSINLALARLLLAETLIAQRRWGEALIEFQTIRDTVQPVDPDTFERRFKFNIDWALALSHTGETKSAISMLRGSVAQLTARFGPTHFSTSEAIGMLGTVLLKAGENQEALAAFKSALPGLLEKIRAGDSDQQRFAAQSFRIGEFINAYISLLTSTPTADLNLAEGLDPVAYAFELAQLAEQGVVQRSLLASSARAAARDPELADLVRRVQDLKYQIDALTGAVANQYSLDAETQDKALIAQMKEQIDELRPARAALVSAIDTQFPLYAQLINPAPLPVEGLKALLRPKEVSIVTHVASDRVHIWVVPYSGELTYASAPFDQQELASTVASLRRALDPKVSILGEIPMFDLGEAYRLYEALLKPIEATWQDAESLLVVADGALGQLPLSLLPTQPVKLGQDKEVLFEAYRGIPWLARTHAVTVLPSVVSLAALRSLPTPSEGRRAFVGFGDPVFSATQLAEATSDNESQTAVLESRGPLATRGLPIKLRALPEMEGVDSAELERLPRLPDTADEVRSIALALNADFTRDVFLGKAANEKTVKTLDLSAYKVLAFATHGLVPGDLNGLTQPALALTAPQVAGVEGDGLLTMGEILGLKLDADWVVLSACNTAAADGAGAEAISGLGRAFFYAGARSLLVSNWPVETTSAKMLTTDVFRRQAQDLSLSRAEALRQAMVALIDGPGYVDGEGRTVFSYAHPIFWAPFTLAGDGGGGGPGA